MERAFTEHGLLALLIVKVGAVQSTWNQLSQNMAFLPLLMGKGRCCSVRMERAFTEHGLLCPAHW